MRGSVAFVLLQLSALTGSIVAAASCPPELPVRPSPVPYPYSHGRPHYVSPPRNKTCYIHAKGNGQDDSQTVFSAFKACNNGGIVAFMDAEYTIAQPLDLTFLNAVDIVLGGQITWTNNITYWLLNTINYNYQTAALFWQIGGKDVNIYGGGTLNGNGQAWWDRMVTNSTLRRPILLGIVGLESGSISGISLTQTPNWFHFVANSSDLIFDNITMHVMSDNSNPVKNSDGWDLYRSDGVTIQNSHVNNTDDCVSFKPNSTNMVVQNMVCTGSHGISVGSLGQYQGEVDLAENLYIYNISMSNASDGARIKVWPGAPPGNTAIGVGGGTGLVRNVTYNGMHDVNDDYAIELTQCYGVSNLTTCHDYPSGMIIEDILFTNFTGSSSKKYDPIVGTLVCSSESVCTNIVATNINIITPSGKTAKWTCKNVDESTLDINCS